MVGEKRFTKEEYEERISKSQKRLDYLKEKEAPPILIDSEQAHLNKVTYDYNKNYHE